MSWAEKIRAAQAVKAPEQDMKKVTVVAPVEGKATADADAEKGEISSVTLPEFKKGLIVLDANAFIKGMDNLLDLADALITVPQVVKEVKDAKARDLLERLPLPLVQLDPTTESMKEVMEMAKRTGDFGALSRTDIRIAALGLDAAKQTSQRKACIVPRPAVINPDDNGKSGVTVHDAEFDNTGDGGADDDSEGSTDSEEGEWEDEEEEEEEQTTATQQPGLTDGDADDDGGEWITASNIKQNQAKDSNGLCTAFQEGGVATVSSDFPIQNVLIHLGVTVVGPTGLQIKQLRSWLLRCHACYGLVHDTTRTFCSHCGSGNTLKRVSYEVAEDGKKNLFINFKKSISKRGTVYMLPKPRGGRRGTNKTLALREDQLGYITNPGRNKKKEQRVLQGDNDAVFGETRKSTFDPNKPREESSYRRYNPNEKKKQLAGRRK